jgi:hypothetical protein
MRAEKFLSGECLQRLMSEIASLREQVKQAERNQAASQVELATAIAVAQARNLSRQDRSRPAGSNYYR